MTHWHRYFDMLIDNFGRNKRCYNDPTCMYVCIHNSRNIDETVCPTAVRKVRRASQTKRIEMIYCGSLSDPYLLCMACWLGRPVIWLGTTVSIYNHIYIVMHTYLWNLTLQYNVLIGTQTIHRTLIDHNGMLLCARNNISRIIRGFFLCKNIINAFCV